MTKEEAYQKATMQELGNNPNGTRQDVVYRAMDIYCQSVRSELSKECKRVKIQRNEYEEELRKANKEIMRLRAELKMKVAV